MRRKMEVDYQKLSERYANFLVAVGGVSITVLALVLNFGESDSSGSKSPSRAFLVAALLAATVSCFIGAHMMAETSAAIDASKGKMGERLFLLASTNIFVAISLVLFALMLLLTTSGKVDADIIRPISIFVFVSVVIGAFIWMVLTARFRMRSGWRTILLPALISVLGFLPCLTESSTKKLSLLFMPIVSLTVVILLRFAWTFDDRGRPVNRDIWFFVSTITFTYVSLVVAGIKTVFLN